MFLLQTPVNPEPSECELAFFKFREALSKGAGASSLRSCPNFYPDCQVKKIKFQHTLVRDLLGLIRKESNYIPKEL